MLKAHWSGLFFRGRYPWAAAAEAVLLDVSAADLCGGRLSQEAVSVV